MNFSLRLCTLTLLMFGCTLQVQAVTTPEEIRSLANKVEQGTKLSDEEFNQLNTLNKQNPGLLTNNMLRQLRSLGKLRNSQNNSSRKGIITRRANTARKLRKLLPEDAQENSQASKDNLVSLVGQLAEDLEQADYAGFHDLIEACLGHINTLEIDSNTPKDIASTLKTALEYGIAEVVEYLVKNDATVTQADIDYLTQAQTESEGDSDSDCAWFKSGANFEICRELLEAVLAA